MDDIILLIYKFIIFNVVSVNLINNCDLKTDIPKPYRNNFDVVSYTCQVKSYRLT